MVPVIFLAISNNLKNATPLPLLDENEDLKKNCPLQGIIENYSKITINLCCEKKP